MINIIAWAARSVARLFVEEDLQLYYKLINRIYFGIWVNTNIVMGDDLVASCRCNQNCGGHWRENSCMHAANKQHIYILRSTSSTMRTAGYHHAALLLTMLRNSLQGVSLCFCVFVRIKRGCHFWWCWWMESPHVDAWGCSGELETFTALALLLSMLITIINNIIRASSTSPSDYCSEF